MTETTPPKQSDLGVRAASAVVMVAVAGTALWLGGWVFDCFIVLISLAAIWEFSRLVQATVKGSATRVVSNAAVAAYVGLAAWLLVQINTVSLILLIIGSVILVDIFAYFFGRTLGGPKIAPSISPSKTWAGLLGGIIGATTALFSYFAFGAPGDISPIWFLEMLPFGALIAVVAQSGDFFESWLKRRAGVKDSSNLIPGHGGILDRVDGLLPVAIVIGSILVTVYPHWLNQ